jgi:transposase
MSRREELIELCGREPEVVVDLLLALEGKVSELESKVRELEARQKRTSRNSNQPPSSDGLKKPARQSSKSKRKGGGQAGREGHTLRFSDKPDEVIRHEAAICQDCGAELRGVAGTVLTRRQEVELPQQPVQVIEHQQIERVCPCCGRRNRGVLPEHLRGNVQYGRRFKAFCAYVMIYQLLPYERTAELLETLLGYRPGGGTLKRLLEEAYSALEPIEKAIRTAIRGSPVGHGDETSLRIAGHTRWVHVFSTPSYTHYYWSRYRGQKAHQADGLLPSYEGVLMHDAYSSYFGHDYEHALCNAHLLRELQAIYDLDPTQGWTWQLMRLLRVAWALVKRAKAQDHSHLPADQQARILALFEQIVARADQQNPPNQRQPGQRGRVAQSDARNLIDRLILHQTAYLRFVSDFQVPFDNNLAERDLRMSKLQQKISGCFRTEQGADIFCRIRAYISTLRKQGHQLLPALCSLFTDDPFFPTPAE